MALGVGSFTRRVTWLTKVSLLSQQEKVEFMSILTFSECKKRRHMQKEKFLVLEKMDPRYSSWGLN
jgi:hypothetical protein